MRELPILFSAPMVRADLEDRKTMTRRVVKPQPESRGVMGVTRMLAFKKRSGPDYWLWPNAKEQVLSMCPYGQPGDQLWVREAWRTSDAYDACRPAQMDSGASLFMLADGCAHRVNRRPELGPERWGRYRHARFMPRWASRLTLEVVAVRVERLQDISEADAIAEGLLRDGDGWRGAPDLPWFASPVAAYRSLWQSINGIDSWNANPWVWVVEFKRADQAKAA